MAWDRTTPTNPKYHTPEHRAVLAGYKAQLKRDGFVVCAADVCLYPSRAITNSRGRDDDGLTAGHYPDGVTYRGPEHRACNIRDAAVRARAKQQGPTRWNL